MIETIALTPGVTLRHCRDGRFKKGAVSVSLLRPMCEQEAALNALLPAVLLRGTKSCPDLRQITDRLDELYGASVSCLCRRIGDIQTMGFYMTFLEDRFAMAGDRVLEPGVEFLRELLLEPALVWGMLRGDYVESEKTNLISTIEAELNDKQRYANAQMSRYLCAGDSFGVPRLGTPEQVRSITAGSLTAHYRRLLQTSPVEIFYVGEQSAQTVAELLRPLAQGLGRQAGARPQTRAFLPVNPPRVWEQEMEVSQTKLSMGFYTPITNQDPRFAAMMVANVIFGGSATSKLFLNVREKQSLCYYASSGYTAAKGIVNVSCGVDGDNAQRAKEEILHQLELLAAGEITPEELHAAKAAAVSSLRSVPDSPGSIEGYYAVAEVAGLHLDIPEYIGAVEAVTAAEAAAAAATLKLHSVFFLKGVSADE